MDKIMEKCLNNDLTFIKFVNDENKYKNNKTKLELKCNICGYTWNTTSYDKFVSRKSYCPQCNNKKHLKKEEIEKKILKRCEELNYTFLGFKDVSPTTLSKIILKCNNCNKIWETTTVSNFLKKDRNSHKCGRNNPSSMPSNYKDKKIVLAEIKKILDKTSLEFISFKDEYEGLKKCVINVRCKICGKETTILYNTLKQNKFVNCKNCQYNGKISNNDAINNILNKCKLLNYTFLGFNNDDNYYSGKNTKLILQCNKCGRIWKSTSYTNFINSVIKCTSCNNSWKMEKEIKMLLDENNIEYEEQKTFEWLKNKSQLFIDFYLPKHHIFIECQGRQHFVPVSIFGGKKGFKETQLRDSIKYNECKKHGIKPIYYSNKKWEYCNGEKTINDLNKILNIIKNG